MQQPTYRASTQMGYLLSDIKHRIFLTMRLDSVSLKLILPQAKRPDGFVKSIGTKLSISKKLTLIASHEII